MPFLFNQQLTDYQANTFHLTSNLRIKTKEQAIQFVNQRGFVFFWPIQDICLPSLWAAVAGDRPVADEHDDPGHITWGWKDELLGKHVWYYARILRRRNTIISLDTIPYFYALSPNYGDPEFDYLEQYEQGLLPQEAKSVYEALLNEGPLDTISLRKAARLSSAESTTRFNRAIDQLQIELKVLPTGIAEAGAWRYAFIYDLTHRHYPALAEQARPITEGQARMHLIWLYIQSVGAAREKDIQKLFGWKPEYTQRAIHKLLAEQKLITSVEVENQKGEWCAIPELFTPTLS